MTKRSSSLVDEPQPATSAANNAIELTDMLSHRMNSSLCLTATFIDCAACFRRATRFQESGCPLLLLVHRSAARTRRALRTALTIRQDAAVLPEILRGRELGG